MQTAPTRRLPSWIDGFLAFNEGKKSPELFKKWAAISAIAAAMERRIWIRTATGELFPNIYVFLVGPPGGGKSVALNAAEKLLKDCEEVKIAPNNISAASLTDALNEAKRRVIDLNSPYLEFNSLYVSASELSVLLPAYDPGTMANLTKFWDNEPFKEWKRGGGLRIEIAKPQINLLGGCTPEFLTNFLPTGAWGQGFMARVLMVYCGDTPRKKLFNIEQYSDEDRPEYKVLLSDLKAILGVVGEMRATPEAEQLIQAWDDAGGPPAPEHSKLINYTTRRTTQIIKLSMISSMSRGSDLLITAEDYQTALGWLLEIEAHMAEIFKAMGTGGTDSQAIEEVWRFIYQTYISASSTPVSEHKIVYFLQQRVPANAVMRIIDLLVKSNMVTKEFNKMGQASYKPTPKHLHATI